jgi:hypothetical protein
VIAVADVEAAAGRLDGVAHRTPVVTSRTLDARVEADVFLKAENLQRGGAFKFRGAYNKVSSVDGDVAAYSSGNHAQAVALAASLLDRQAVILMPEDAPAAKVAATLGYGAEVVTYDRYTQDRDELGWTLAAERGADAREAVRRPARDGRPGNGGARAARRGRHARPACRRRSAAADSRPGARPSRPLAACASSASSPKRGTTRSSRSPAARA